MFKVGFTHRVHVGYVRKGIKDHSGGFPGGLVVKTLYFPCRGCEFDPWLRN